MTILSSLIKGKVTKLNLFQIFNKEIRCYGVVLLIGRLRRPTSPIGKMGKVCSPPWDLDLQEVDCLRCLYVCAQFNMIENKRNELFKLNIHGRPR